MTKFCKGCYSCITPCGREQNKVIRLDSYKEKKDRAKRIELIKHFLGEIKQSKDKKD